MFPQRTQRLGSRYSRFLEVGRKKLSTFGDYAGQRVAEIVIVKARTFSK
jgi:hypothetical protein